MPDGVGRGVEGGVRDGVTAGVGVAVGDGVTLGLGFGVGVKLGNGVMLGNGDGDANVELGTAELKLKFESIPRLELRFTFWITPFTFVFMFEFAGLSLCNIQNSPAPAASTSIVPSTVKTTVFAVFGGGGGGG